MKLVPPHHLVPPAAVTLLSQYPLDSFLGAFIPPEQLSMSQVKSPAPPGSWEATVANAGLLLPGVAGEAAWHLALCAFTFCVCRLAILECNQLI